jgi:hypothetical protein
MLLFATYCSADKDGAAGNLPAIERYVSDRINGVCANAQGAQARFGILSGMYGLISADHPLPYYDHLLQTDQIEAMVTTVQSTLTEWEVTEVRWFSVAFEMDPNVRRYRDVMAQAAHAANARFELTLWEPTGTLGLI